MDVAWVALGVSGLSLVVSATSLVWNIHSFKRSGPQVEIDLASVVFVAPIDEITQAFGPMFPEARNKMSDADAVLAKRILLIVRVINKGRGAIELSHVSIEVGPKKSSIPFRDRKQPFPLKLEGGFSTQLADDGI